MSGETVARRTCPQCGYKVPSNDGMMLEDLFRPWDLSYGRKAVKAYVQSLAQEAHEWLLALYVDNNFRLLAVDTLAVGDLSSCPAPMWKPIDRAKALGAAGFLLVHNHPSGDPTPSYSDIMATRRLALISKELDVPLLDHFVIAGDEMREIAGWGWDDDPYLRRRLR